MNAKMSVNAMSVFEDRRQVFGWVNLISAMTLMLFVLLHELEGCCRALLWVESMLAAVMLFTYWRIRLGANLAHVENVLMACGLVLFSALVFFESIEATGIYWLAGFPFVAYFVQQVKKARYWVAAFIVELLVAAALQAMSLIEMPYTAMQLFQITGVLAFYWLFAHLYQSQLEWRKQQLKESYLTLAQQQSHLQVILDHSPLGIWMVDENRHIQFLNKSWAKICGVSEQQAQAAVDYSTLLPSDMAKRVLASDEACMESDEVNYRRHEISSADGQLRTFDFIKVRLTDADGQVSGLVAFAIDVTDKLAAEAEQKSLEQQIQHSQRLESLGIMAGGIAHDFNNLLMVIQGNVELALLEEDLSEQVEEALSCVEEASQAATDLCRQMLDYSGKGVMKAEAINVEGLIEGMLSLLYASKSTHVSLSFHADKQAAWILADRGQIKQVLLNLVINASEAIAVEKTGEIHVSIHHRQLGTLDVARFSDVELKPGPYVVLEVEDNGTGMEAETIEHMFDPFFTTKFTGRGLGMSAILGILRSHAAGMEVKSRLGQGTTMSVWLPSIDVDTTIQSIQDRLATRALSGRVLVVDDEPAVIHVARRMLQHLGLTSVAATNGLEAVDIFSQDTDFDWVLLDVAMPEMDGKACLKALRAIRPDIYVVMSSGYDTERVLLREKDCCPNDFLSKPYSMDMLRACVATIHTQHASDR